MRIIVTKPAIARIRALMEHKRESIKNGQEEALGNAISTLGNPLLRFDISLTNNWAIEQIQIHITNKLRDDEVILTIVAVDSEQTYGDSPEIVSDIIVVCSKETAPIINEAVLSVEEDGSLSVWTSRLCFIKQTAVF